MTVDAGKEQAGGRFQPGQSGNPAGRRAGTLNRVSVMAQQMMEGDAEDVILALLKAAKGGDVSAMKLVLERVAPLPRNRPVHFAAPVIETAADLGNAMGAVLQAVAAGDLTPDEAVSIASLVETRRRTIETLELDTRIAALEQSKAALHEGDRATPGEAGAGRQHGRVVLRMGLGRRDSAAGHCPAVPRWRGAQRGGDRV